MLLKIRHQLVKTAFLAVCLAMLINSNVWAQTGQTLDVNNGETRNELTISKDSENAILNINNGGTATNTTVQNDGVVNVYNNGTASDTTVKNMGTLNIQEAGFATGTTTIENGGLINASSGGGIINNLVVEDGGMFELTNTAEIANISVEGQSGSIAGANANNIVINDGSTLYVRDGSASGTIVQNGGTLNIGNSATVTGTTVETGGSFVANSSGSTISDITIQDGGAFELSTNVDVSDLKDKDGNSLGSIASGTATNVILNKGSILDVESSDVAENTTVNDGQLNVFGTANTVTVTGTGKVEVETGGVVDGATLTGVDAENMAVMDVEGTAKNTTLSSFGEMNVDGTAETTTINNNGVMNVYGTATDTTVKNGGKISALGSDAIVDILTIETGGKYDISTGVELSNATINGTDMGTITNNVAEDVLINDGSVLQVESGHTAKNTIVQNGGTIASNSAGIIDGLTIQDGGAFDLTTETELSGLKDGNGTDLDGSITGNVAENITVTEGSTLAATRGGVIKNSSAVGGTIAVVDGIAENVTVSNNGTIVANTFGANVLDTHIEATGNYDFSTNANVSATYGSDNKEIIINNQSVTSAFVGNGSKLTIEANSGKAESVVVDGGTMIVNEEASAKDTTVSSGEMNVDGGIVEKLTVKGTGVVNTENKANLNTVIVENGGKVNLDDFSLSNMTTISSGGSLNIENDANASNTTVNAQGIINVGQKGYATSTTINDAGVINIKNGGSADIVTINANGILNMDAGSTVSSLTMEKDSIINIADGSLLKGLLTIDVGANLSGSSLDFSNLFADGANNLEIVTFRGGVNSAFGGNLENNDPDNRSLILKDGAYIISNSGQTGAVNVSGWNTIEFDNANIRLESDLSLNGTNKSVSINETANLDVSGNDVTIGGTLINAGTIDLSGNSLLTQDVLTIDGDYSSDEADIIMDINPLNNTADKIVINGNVYGKTSVYMKSNSPKTTNESILFVDAPNNVNGGADSFEIWRVEKSPFIWDVLFENNKWYAYVTNGDSPVIVPETAAYYGLIDNTFMQTASLGANLRNNIAINEFRKVACKLAKNQKYSNRLCRSAQPVFTGWVAPVYSSATVEAPYNYKATLSGVDGGLDLISNGVAKLGLLASYRNGTYTYDESGETYTLQGEAETAINSYLAGAYMRLDGNYWSVLLAGYGGILDAEVSTEDGVNSDTSGTTFGATLDVNFIYKNVSGLRIEPGVRISYTSVKMDEISDNAGKVQEFDNASRTEVEAGLRVAKRWEFPEARAEIFVKPAVVQTMNSASDFELVEERLLDSTEDRTIVKIEAGMSFDMIENWSASVAGSYSFGSDYTNTAANLSVIYNF